MEHNPNQPLDRSPTIPPSRIVLLKRWQRHILHHQLQMLDDIFDLIVPFIESFFPPMIREIEMWRNINKESFEESYLQTDTTAFRPATYYSIACNVGGQLHKHIKVKDQFVFSTESFRVGVDGVDSDPIDIIEMICKHHSERKHMMVFFTYEHCKELPFSKVATTWNNRVYVSGAGDMGPLDYDTLNSLSKDSNFVGATSIVFLFYNYEDDKGNEFDEDNTSDNAIDESIDNFWC
jgi:hypothetical protein